jgi:hypothetical protein
MIFSISNEKKRSAALNGVAACEEDVFMACMSLNIDPVSVADDYSSDDPSYEVLSDAMQKLRDAKAYLAAL